MKPKLTELKQEIEKITIMVGEFNSSLSVNEKTSKKKINKDVEDLEQHYQST